eukprot:760976-Hanusia_phi.AAC.1
MEQLLHPRRPGGPTASSRQCRLLFGGGTIQSSRELDVFSCMKAAGRARWATGWGRKQQADSDAQRPHPQIARSLGSSMC